MGLRTGRPVSTHMSLGKTTKRVRIVEVVTDKNRVVVEDEDGISQHEVELHIRVGGLTYPQVGQEWIIDKDMVGRWMFLALITDAAPPVITASRSGASALTLQVLDALIALGLVVDHTTGDPDSPED